MVDVGSGGFRSGFGIRSEMKKVFRVLNSVRTFGIGSRFRVTNMYRLLSLDLEVFLY